MRIEKTILLVDDDEQDVTSFRRALEKIDLPLTLHTAFTSNEAITLLKEKNLKPDFIFLGLNMPEMSGIEFLEKLREDSTYQAVRVFVMSTSNERKDQMRIEEFGVSGYILKPMNFTENTKRSLYMDYFMHFQIMKILNYNN